MNEAVMADEYDAYFAEMNRRDMARSGMALKTRYDVLCGYTYVSPEWVTPEMESHLRPVDLSVNCLSCGAPPTRAPKCGYCGRHR